MVRLRAGCEAILPGRKRRPVRDRRADGCSPPGRLLELPDETRNRSFQKEWLAVTLSAAIYGFGSAFSDAASSNDIDILILHPSGDVAACRFAIECKARSEEQTSELQSLMRNSYAVFC